MPIGQPPPARTQFGPEFSYLQEIRSGCNSANDNRAARKIGRNCQKLVRRMAIRAMSWENEVLKLPALSI
jgi:hypothetical protein